MKINPFNTRKAIYDFLDANISIPVKSYLEDYSAQSDDFVKVTVTPTENTSSINGDSNIERGIVTIMINNKSGSEFVAMYQANSIKSVFEHGTANGIEFDGQKVSISNITQNPTQMIDGWIKTPITIAYSAFN